MQYSSTLRELLNCTLIVLNCQWNKETHNPTIFFYRNNIFCHYHRIHNSNGRCYKYGTINFMCLFGHACACVFVFFDDGKSRPHWTQSTNLICQLDALQSIAMLCHGEQFISIIECVIGFEWALADEISRNRLPSIDYMQESIRKFN